MKIQKVRPKVSEEQQQEQEKHPNPSHDHAVKVAGKKYKVNVLCGYSQNTRFKRE